jgi:hypothetical protein
VNTSSSSAAFNASVRLAPNIVSKNNSGDGGVTIAIYAGRG